MNGQVIDNRAGSIELRNKTCAQLAEVIFAIEVCGPMGASDVAVACDMAYYTARRLLMESGYFVRCGQFNYDYWFKWTPLPPEPYPPSNFERLYE